MPITSMYKSLTADVNAGDPNTWQDLVELVLDAGANDKWIIDYDLIVIGQAGNTDGMKLLMWGPTFPAWNAWTIMGNIDTATNLNGAGAKQVGYLNSVAVGWSRVTSIYVPVRICLTFWCGPNTNEDLTLSFAPMTNGQTVVIKKGSSIRAVKE